MKDLKSIIAENLAYLRKSSKMTQLELAEKLNYSDKSISKWEHGETMPDIEVLKQIADLYGVSIDFITTENAKDNAPKFLKQNTFKNKQNQIIVTFLAVSIVWIIASIIFVYTNIILQANYWLVFLWSIPTSVFVCLYFNKLWGTKKYKFILISAFVWSLLPCIYFQFLAHNIWPLFLIAIPTQVAIILWSKIKIN
ncbi:MAG: helix-turn-helix transcriptional regulator [Clostridia bacterium]|nr:helix-turn-helix transcriptional regulator [Clostridia bacterium]